MKSLVFIAACLGLIITAKSQINPNFKSDIINANIIDSLWTEISPIHNDTTSPLIKDGINQSLVMEKFVDELNKFREEQGLSPVSMSNQLSQYLTGAMEYDLPLNLGFTWGTYGTFSEYGYVSKYKDVERSFCRYLIDVMSIDSVSFNDLTNPDSKEVGYYITQNMDDKTYNFMVYIK